MKRFSRVGVATAMTFLGVVSARAQQVSMAPEEEAHPARTHLMWSWPLDPATEADEDYWRSIQGRAALKAEWNALPMTALDTHDDVEAVVEAIEVQDAVGLSDAQVSSLVQTVREIITIYSMGTPESLEAFFVAREGAAKLESARRRHKKTYADPITGEPPENILELIKNGWFHRYGPAHPWVGLNSELSLIAVSRVTSLKRLFGEELSFAVGPQGIYMKGRPGLFACPRSGAKQLDESGELVIAKAALMLHRPFRGGTYPAILLLRWEPLLSTWVWDRYVEFNSHPETIRYRPLF